MSLAREQHLRIGWRALALLLPHGINQLRGRKFHDFAEVAFQDDQ